MDIKNIIRISFLIPVLFICLACPSNECKDAENIQLKLLADYSPLVDTFRIGDTLNIFSKFSDSIFDIKSMNYFIVPDFNFYSLIIMRRSENGTLVDLDTQEDQIVNNSTNYSVQNYSISGGTGIDIEKHNYDTNEYEFSIGYVFKKTGLYVVSVGSLIGFDNSTSNQNIPGQCSNQEISAIYHRPGGNMDSNLEDYNFQMFRETEADVYASFTEEDFKEIAFYAFYVKE